MEIDSQISPLVFTGFGDIVDGADMERHELLLVDGNQYSQVVFIHKKLSGSHVLRHVLHRRIGTNLIEVLLLLFFNPELDVVFFQSLFKFVQLRVQKLRLSLFDILFRRELVHMIICVAHVPRPPVDDVFLVDGFDAFLMFFRFLVFFVFFLIVFVVESVRNVLESAVDLAGEIMGLIGAINVDGVSDSSHDEAFFLLGISNGDPSVKHHIGLNTVILVGSINHEKIFFEVAANTKTKVGVNLVSQRRVTTYNELLRFIINVGERLAHFEERDKVLLGIVGDLVGFLLLGSWINYKSSARHGVHVIILSADVHVYGISIVALGLQLVLVALHVELVQSEVLWSLPRLQQHGQWIF